MYALTRLGSGKARCFSSKSSRSCVGSPKTKRPDGSSACQKQTGEMGTSYQTFLRDSESLEDLRGVTSYQSYPWHAHSFRIQPDLDSFQWQWRLGSSPNGAPTNWHCGHLANGFVRFEHRPGIHCWNCFRILFISEVSCRFYWYSSVSSDLLVGRKLYFIGNFGNLFSFDLL